MLGFELPPRTLSTELLSVIHEYSYTRLCFAPVIIGGNSVHSASVRDLGVWIDRGLSMSTHVTKVVAGSFADLLYCVNFHSIRRSVSRESLIGLVQSLVMTRLDYCNAVLAGLSAYQLDRLQSVINAAARMIYRASRYDHVSSLQRASLVASA